MAATKRKGHGSLAVPAKRRENEKDARPLARQQRRQRKKTEIACQALFAKASGKIRNGLSFFLSEE